jgi:bifunctional UDP-N-acetylglucosamine pyrophosphorylase / glucosamine-1-phosphate N-acetyltransferase
MTAVTLPLSIIILAAGQGKRMKSALPKVVHPLGGKPLLAHVLKTAATLHPQCICVVIGHGNEPVIDAVGSLEDYDNYGDIAWVKQSPQLGTGHAVLQAVPHLPGSGVALVLYGDVPLVGVETLENLVVRSGGESLALLTQSVENPHGYGRIVRDAQQRVQCIVEEKDASETERAIREINTGIMAIPAGRLANWLSRLTNANAQQEYYLTDIVALAIADGVEVVAAQPRFSWEFLGVNSKNDLAGLERVHQKHAAERLLAVGVTLADPARIDVRGELDCGRDVSIDVNCIFEGKVTLADGVKIGAHCILRNASVGAGSTIEPYSFIDGARIGAHARIGPYARLRPDTEIGDEVHIGNFVEVKNSQIGSDSKANHLAYIGDATVGKHVNIGAGTITCNYDGANKHRTIIEDDVQIGSDVQLVAPVTIGKGATIGAGATITKDALPGELTFTRKEQITRPGWKRPAKKPQ